MRLTIFSAKRGEIIWAWCRIFEVNFRGSGQHLGTQAYTVRHQAVGVCILFPFSLQEYDQLFIIAPR